MKGENSWGVRWFITIGEVNKMGGGGKGSSTSSGKTNISPLESTLASISGDLYNATSGLRGNYLDKYAKALSGTYDFQTDPTYAPMFQQAKQGIESQYNVGKQNILSSTPAGGGLVKALSNLDIARAGDMGTVPANLENQIYQQLMGGAQSAAWNTPQTSMAGLGQANNTYGMRLMQQNSQNAAGKAGLGQGLGNLAGIGLTAALI
jgi:hypothetical protein